MRQDLLDILNCPVHHTKLQLREDCLVCEAGDTYPIIDHIPIFLVEGESPTHSVHFRQTKDAVEGKAKQALVEEKDIDEYVQGAVAETCGIMYMPLIRNLKRYPIPVMPINPQRGKTILDIGCNWGRWCISAAKKGFTPVGIDPSFEAVRAAKRVCHQLGFEIDYLVADARHLPFKNNSFDIVFSYSVFQHFDKADTIKSLREIQRILKRDGYSFIQMLNKLGLRSQYHLLKRGYREGSDFEVRYWTPWELKRAFSQSIGPSSLSVDGFFSANAQWTDLDILPNRFKLVVLVSELMKRISKLMPLLPFFADSLYIKSKVRDPFQD